LNSYVIFMRHTLLPIGLYLFGLMFSPVSQAEGYELGQGLPVGDFLLSGYVNIELVDRFDAPTKLDLDDLSLFASGRINQWINPFLEAELSQYTLVQQGGGSGGGDFVIERIYNDSIVTEQGTLRIGQMLTPLGDWNLVHAAPLIPIITRPFTTARGFEAYASGVSWLHDPMSNSSPNWQLYWQPDTEWFKRPASQAPRSFHNVYGGQISLSMGLLDKIGACFQHGLLIETGETFTLYGINANKAFGKLELVSEAITASFTGTVLPGATPRLHDNESGIFGLADYAVTPKWHGIVEGEYYQDHTVSGSSRNTLVAAAYKPSVPVVWKLEYIHQAGVSASFATIRTGWKASFSALF
jgi:hypothetical protein